MMTASGGVLVERAEHSDWLKTLKADFGMDLKLA
jgi:hypothetical protein